MAGNPSKKSNTQSSLKREIEFLYEVGSLRYVERTWKQFFQSDVASNAEHMFRVSWIALIIARREGVTNEEKILKMALIHDVAESRSPDTNYVSKIYSTRNEEKALKHILDKTNLENDFMDIFKEYEARESIESKIVKDADNLDVDFEIQEMAKKGHQLKKDWTRTTVRKKLFTKTAKQIWDELQDSNPSSWHVSAHEQFSAPKDRK